MIEIRLTNLFHWLADAYLLSTVMLAIGLAVMYRFKQPSRRMPVARSAVAGLAGLAMHSTVPDWPRIAGTNLRVTAPAVSGT